MLFNINESARNSLLNARERNLYFKIFGGFIFNEMIIKPTLEKRVEAFLEIAPVLLPYSNYGENENTKTLLQLLGLRSPVDVANAAISFDNHLTKIDKRTEDVPEFADIALWLPKNRLLAIEAKYTQGWNGDKDVFDNMNRISNTLTNNIPNSFIKYDIDKAVFSLLILERKLETQKIRSNSVLNKLDKSKIHPDITACVITWEAIIRKMNSEFPVEFEKVNNYFTSSLDEMEAQKRI